MTPTDVDLQRLFVCDTFTDGLQLSLRQIEQSEIIRSKYPNLKIHPLIVEEELWPFASESLDLVVSNLNLHWVNDLQAAL